MPRAALGHRLSPTHVAMLVSQRLVKRAVQDLRVKLLKHAHLMASAREVLHRGPFAATAQLRLQTRAALPATPKPIRALVLQGTPVKLVNSVHQVSVVAGQQVVVSVVSQLRLYRINAVLVASPRTETRAQQIPYANNLKHAPQASAKAVLVQVLSRNVPFIISNI